MQNSGDNPKASSGDYIVLGYFSGLVGQLVSLHADYYSKHWDFGRAFETKVATELSSFIDRYDESRDRIWSIVGSSGVQCSITIDGSGTGGAAHLRWFITSEAARGKGYGNKLLNLAVQFCRERSFNRIHLWTFHGLDEARHLYEKSGFQLREEQEGTTWGTAVIEQRFEYYL